MDALADPRWLLGQDLHPQALLPASRAPPWVTARRQSPSSNRGSACQPSPPKTEPRSTTRIGARGCPLCSVTAGRSAPMPSKTRCFYLAEQGYRCIAHDRRGHGRSGQPWDGNDMDSYADDLAQLVDKLDLKGAVHVGHSTGGGEVTRYIGRHGSKRVAKAVLIGAVPPVMLKSARNPRGTPIEAFNQIRASVLADRSQFFSELALPFYGYNRPGAKLSEGARQSFWLQAMMAGMPACYFCVKAFSETDMTEDLKTFDVPTLILHGDDDQIVPFADSAELSVKLVKNAKLKVYQGSPHGMCTTEKDKINEDLLAFIKS